MAFDIPLREFTYLSLDEVKDWLKINPTDTSKDVSLKRLINSCCEMVERYIDGPVLTRDFTEFRDGNSSNVVVPSMRPVVSLTAVYIDYNRDFAPSTLVDPQQTILRGLPNVNQKSTDLSVRIIGSDIVLRDDNNTALLGRIFAGSVVQSIKLLYRAGWGDSPDRLPEDLKQATLLAIEFYYMLRENRDLGVNSRNSMGGQGYRREKTDSGLPTEVELMLDRFRDYSLGVSEVPQKNTFTL